MSVHRNTYAERFVHSVRSECLDHVFPLGQGHLRLLLKEYVAHYHLERNHQGLDDRLIEPLPSNTNAAEGPVIRKERLGGLLNYYIEKPHN